SGGVAGSSPLAHSLPKAALPRPTMSTLLPQAFTGTSTGTCTSLPEATPGEPSATPCAWAPDPPWPWPPSSEPLTQVLPKVGLSTPTTSTLLPQALTPTSTGTCTLFPDSTPGECLVT